MRRSTRRAAAAVAAGAALSGLVVSGASASGSDALAARQVVAGAQAQAVSGGRLWVARYRGLGNDFNEPAKVAASPDGRTVYVTGQSLGTNLYHDFATIAYNAATGARLWVARYNGPGNRGDEAESLAVSPNGRTVYVTGWSTPAAGDDSNCATIAYNAANGARLWVARSSSGGAAVAVSPDGGKIYVAGRAITKSGGSDFAVVAYKASTGARLWARRYDGPAHDYDFASSIAVSTAGTVFITGESRGATVATQGEVATIAYSPAGSRLWVARSGGGGAAVAVSPAGRTVYVTGSGRGANAHSDYATIAFKASTGARQWARRYDGPSHGNDFASSLAVSPAGTVAVTGSSGTIAYSPAGNQLWVSRYTAPGSSFWAASVAAPGNGKVYITGTSTRQTSGDDYLTIAYNIATGTTQWARRYSGPGPDGNNADAARSVAARAGRVFVTGSSEGTNGRYEYTTIAYNS